MSKYQVIFFCFSLSFFFSCAQKLETESKNEIDKKINGISFVASGEAAAQKHIDPLLKVNANNVTVMPFGFLRDQKSPEIIYNTKRHWYGETREGVEQYISMLHKNGFEVMLKPQIWISRGEYTGYLKMASEEEWEILENSYRNFILEFASLAEETHTSIFCIGTELDQFIVNRPKFWMQLISEIKTVYSGRLTYAANWDEYKRVPFWKELDYIGVDAYFPISESKTPTVEEAQMGWKPWKIELKEVSERENRKILFTEYGYRSVDFSGKEPWKSDRDMTIVNHEAQNNTTEAVYKEIWPESWFAGGYLWKWFMDHPGVGGMDNTQFTPQNKPVEEVVRKYYSSYH